MRGWCGGNTSQEVRGGPFEVLTLEGRPEGHIGQREKLFSKTELQLQRLKATTMLSSFIKSPEWAEVREPGADQIIKGLTC